MEALKRATSLYSKLLLFFLKAQCALFGRLSRSVAREICEFLSGAKFLPVFWWGELSLYDFRSQSVCFSLATDFKSMRNAMCLVRDSQWLCFPSYGDYREVRSFSAFAGRFTPESATIDSRRDAGVVKFGAFAWLFGGLEFATALRSCEKFDLSARCWTPVTPMPTANAHFTPSVYAEEIYLPSGCDRGVEVYSPQRDAYRRLHSQLSEPGSGQVSLVREGKLVFVCCEGHVRTLDLRSGREQGLAHCARHWTGVDTAPTRERSLLLWSFAGALFEYNVRTGAFRKQSFRRSDG